MESALSRINDNNGAFILVIMVDDVYSKVKLIADSLNIITQCVKYQRVEKPPKGIHMNLLIKINSKLGGVNHVVNQGLGRVFM